MPSRAVNSTNGSGHAASGPGPTHAAPKGLTPKVAVLARRRSDVAKTSHTALVTWATGLSSCDRVNLEDRTQKRLCLCVFNL